MWLTRIQSLALQTLPWALPEHWVKRKPWAQLDVAPISFPLPNKQTNTKTEHSPALAEHWLPCSRSWTPEAVGLFFQIHCHLLLSTHKTVVPGSIKLFSQYSSSVSWQSFGIIGLQQKSVIFKSAVVETRFEQFGPFGDGKLKPGRSKPENNSHKTLCPGYQVLNLGFCPGVL